MQLKLGIFPAAPVQELAPEGNAANALEPVAIPAVASPLPPNALDPVAVPAIALPQPPNALDPVAVQRRFSQRVAAARNLFPAYTTDSSEEEEYEGQEAAIAESLEPAWDEADYSGEIPSPEAGDATNPETLICTICGCSLFDRPRSAFVKCGHTFHSVCIAKSLKRFKICPNCRDNNLEMVGLVEKARATASAINDGEVGGEINDEQLKLVALH